MTRETLSEFRSAYYKYYPLVFSILYARVGNSADAEDISQEVFIRFLNNFDSIEYKKQWLLTALRFEITNYYKKKGNISGDGADLFDLRDDSRLSFVNGMREARMILKEALDNMENFQDEDSKILFDLVAVHKFSYKKAGRFLGLTKSQAEYRYNKIEAKLLEYLEQKGIKGIGDMV